MSKSTTADSRPDVNTLINELADAGHAWRSCGYDRAGALALGSPRFAERQAADQDAQARFVEAVGALRAAVAH